MTEGDTEGGAGSVSFGAELEKTLHFALSEAASRKHEYATLEHLLVALIRDPDASSALIGCGANLEELSKAVKLYLDKEFQSLVTESSDDPAPTAGFQRVIQRAILHVKASGGGTVTGASVLLALFSERDSYSVSFLAQQDISRLDVASFVRNDVGPVWDSQPRDFFISYASEDLEIAQEVDGVLAAAGFSTIAQFKDFRPGMNFVREMQNALELSTRVIALHSPSYEKSDHCQAEWAAAYNQDPGGRSGKLLPVLLKPTALNLLARQIVYTSFVGLSRPERHIALLRLVANIHPEPRSHASVRRAAAEVASPDIVLQDNILDIIPNKKGDRHVGDARVLDSIDAIVLISSTIIEVLPGNSPPVVGSCLTRLVGHLRERREAPILGIISALASSIESEVQATDFQLWGTGLRDLFESLFAQSALFMSFYPGHSDRERVLVQSPVADDVATGEALAEPVRQASTALREISAEELTSKAFDFEVANQLRVSEELAYSSEQHANGSVSSKTRFVIGVIGFYERIVQVISSSASIFDSPSVQAAVTILRKSISLLLRLLKDS